VRLLLQFAKPHVTGKEEPSTHGPLNLRQMNISSS